jgi:hypothetical protein
MRCSFSVQESKRRSGACNRQFELLQEHDTIQIWFDFKLILHLAQMFVDEHRERTFFLDLFLRFALSVFERKRSISGLKRNSLMRNSRRSSSKKPIQ